MTKHNHASWYVEYIHTNFHKKIIWHLYSYILLYENQKLLQFHLIKNREKTLKKQNIWNIIFMDISI